MPATEPLTIRALTIRAVSVPLEPPLQTSAGIIDRVPLVLIDLQSEQGPAGHAYIFTYTPAALGPTAHLLENIAPLIAGQSAAPVALSARLSQRFRLLGTQGLVGMALSGLDMAAWDMLARAQGLPLARLLGASGGEMLPAYCSLRAWAADAVAREAEAAAAQGFTAVKLKFGHPSLAAEREVYAAVRHAVGPAVSIYVDANQAFTLPEAMHRAPHYAEWGIEWLEEPIRGDDLLGHAALKRACPALPIQRGENDWGPEGIAASLSAGASTYLMPDVMKVGGVTGFMKAAALAEAASVPVCSHLFIEYSAHVLMAAANRHRLEWLDIARPILKAGSPTLAGGKIVLAEGAGAGIEWNEAAVARLAA